eukprot:TRINITY_DN25223_c0_g1_i1.p1 TRINITY_DN25223_c0_g1~~TRINITY_DN25223_c0_g1_i1.p1  ORF type:complete len:193 (+),score=28.87 TRINITY_DN25223_c0_g1_i1:71-580(+)
MSNMADLQQWFRQVDADGSGQIEAPELARALALGNLRFSMGVTAQMIRIHDKDGSGSINFDEFVKLHEFLLQMQECFKFYDKDRSGKLTADEIHHAIQNAGFNLESNAFYTLVRTFDPDKTNNLGMEEFIAMTLFLKSSSAVFKAFDPQQTGYIKLDYNQFVYAAVNTR